MGWVTVDRNHGQVVCVTPGYQETVKQPSRWAFANSPPGEDDEPPGDDDAVNPEAGSQKLPDKTDRTLLDRQDRLVQTFCPRGGGW